jgi:hypothetical protein
MNEWPFSSLNNTKLLLIAGLLLLLILLTGGLLIGPRNKLPSRPSDVRLPIETLSGEKPILQLELARNAEDIKAILEPGDKQQNIADARAGNWYDMFPLIPAYTLQLLGLALLVSRALPKHGSWIFRLAVVLILVIAAADYLEDIGINRVLNLMASGTSVSDFDALSTPSIIKWLLLAVVLWGLGLASFWGPSKGYYVLAVLLLASGSWAGKLILPYLWARFT